MPEKVTSLYGSKVTLEYGSYNSSAHNKDYVKLSGIKDTNHMLTLQAQPCSDL